MVNKKEKDKISTEKQPERRPSLAERILSGIFVIGTVGILCFCILLLLMTLI